MNRIDIHVKNVEEPPWMKSLKQFGLLLLSELGKRNWCVSVLLCDDAEYDLPVRFAGYYYGPAPGDHRRPRQA